MNTRARAPENQTPPLENVDLFAYDRPLVEALAQAAPAMQTVELSEIGHLASEPQWIQAGFDANERPPELHAYDRTGARIDEVRFDPAWHALVRVAVERGLHAAPWRDLAPSAHLRRAAKFYLWSQNEAGHGCPISMTYAAVPALRHAPAIAARWEPALASRVYDPRLIPIEQKAGALCGMGMTEKQGGSDVRATQTRAVRTRAFGGDGEYLVTGDKWFCSAPMCDAFLVLARAEGGLSCFLMPRVLPDGTRNAFAILRLKDKLGNRSNASSEVEFDGAYARLVGQEGLGVQTILEMVNHTRLDCITGSAALLRAAFAQAAHHAVHRKTFGKYLAEHALMQNVLADLALESEAATRTFVRVGQAVDDSWTDASAAALRRIGTAVGKYWVCKRAPAATAEALESLGGNGYVEESAMPRLYREAPVNSIWEGSGNINALDVLRVLAKQPEAFEAMRAEIAPAASADARIAASLNVLEGELRDPAERDARRIVERLALTWQAALMRRDAPGEIADAFVASRIAGDWGHAFGTLPRWVDAAGVMARAWPPLENARPRVAGRA